MQVENVSYWINLIAKSGDETAFAKLYRHYFSGLVSFSYSMLKDKQRCEEVIEDVFIKLWISRDRLTSIDNITQYLYTAVKNSCINVLNRERNIHFEEIGDSLEVSFVYAEKKLIEKENLKKIANAVNALPNRCKLIFRLIKEEGLSYNEVAELLEISIKTVDTQLNIAINKIADVLKNELPEYKTYYRRRNRL
jgi:RNA polymerase sigma-70 factor (ECF subfamily)